MGIHKVPVLETLFKIHMIAQEIDKNCRRKLGGKKSLSVFRKNADKQFLFMVAFSYK